MSSSDRHFTSPSTEDTTSSTSKNYALSGKIMLTSIVILFVVVIFLVLLHLYARWYLLRLHRHTRRRNRRNRSSRIIFTVDNNQSSSPTSGLETSVLATLPVFIYSEKNGENDLNDENVPECAVCLAEFEEGEKGRLLPKCKHSFHTECIDMWFFSHSTCPLCRSPVETTSLADRRKGIDVPSRTESVTETELPSLFKSPGGSRLLSFKRIISMSRRSPAVSPSSGVGPSSTSLPVSTESDLESGVQESELESTRSETVILR